MGTRWSTIVFEEGRAHSGRARSSRTGVSGFLARFPKNPYKVTRQARAVPLAAYLDLVRATVENVAELGPATALTFA